MFFVTTLVQILVLLCMYIKTSESSSVLFGFKSKDASFISASTALSHSGVTIRDNFDWIRTIGETLVGFNGDTSDCEDLFNVLDMQNEAYALNFDGKCLSCEAIAHLCQRIISQRLRTNQRMDVSLLIAGRTKVITDGAIEEPTEDDNAVEVGGSAGVPKLFWLDSIGSLQDVSYGAHGADTPFLLSMLDQHHAANPLSIAAEVEDCKSSDEEDKAEEDGAESKECSQSHHRFQQQSSSSSSPLGGSSGARNSRGSAKLSPVELTRQCWTQLLKRSRSRIDARTVRLCSAGPDGCSNISV